MIQYWLTVISLLSQKLVLLTVSNTPFASSQILFRLTLDLVTPFPARLKFYLLSEIFFLCKQPVNYL